MRLALTVATFLMLGSTCVFADDWTVVRVRGGVFAFDKGQWTQLLRDSVVSDDRIIRSAPGGRATFVRGAETIEVGSDTTIQIDDSKRGFTTVYEHAGTVGVDAEARNVQHFAVQTAFVAAVVKGTAFVVKTDTTASTVAVSRGTVAVHDEHFDTNVAVHAGNAVASSDEPVTVASVTAIPRGMMEPPAPAAEQPVPATGRSANRSDSTSGAQENDPNAAGTGSGVDGGTGNSGGPSNGGGHGHSNNDNGSSANGRGGDNSDHGHSNGNSGNGNSGTGHGNSGNDGNGHSGSSNGHGSSENGTGNSGNGNSGNGRSGNENSGNGNSGSSHGNGNSSSGSSTAGSQNSNSGNGNSGNGNSGGHGKSGK